MPSTSQLASRSFEISAITHLVMIGWAGRDSAAVEAHIRELMAMGLPRPTRIPVFYRVASSLLTTSDTIEVVGTATSGEVEFVLVTLDDGLWVGLGSDHTDRDAERTSVALSKQLCAKPVASTLWNYADVEPHWDRLTLRAWAHRAGTRSLYQEGRVSAILAPEQLVSMYEAASAPLAAGTALFSGTVAAVAGVAPADEFEMELEDPVLGRTLRGRYRVVSLPVNS